jgi:hypothetical protein
MAVNHNYSERYGLDINTKTALSLKNALQELVDSHREMSKYVPTAVWAKNSDALNKAETLLETSRVRDLKCVT